MDARKYASGKKIVLKRNNAENAELNAFTIYKGQDDEAGEDQIGLKCPTVPSIILAPAGTGNVVDKIDFMVEENPFLQYIFLEEIIASFERKVGKVFCFRKLVNFSQSSKQMMTVFFPVVNAVICCRYYGRNKFFQLQWGSKMGIMRCCKK